MRIAVIDLGTNTFHILIAEKEGQGALQHLYRERYYVRLAEEGIGNIGVNAFNRGLTAMIKFAGIIREYQVEKVKAIGTAALRTADNGPDFIDMVRKETGIEVSLISGREEACLIHAGVRQAVPLTEEKVLIMDIGGGSVEFIIANQKQVYWYESFPVGVAILFYHFHRSDPITNSEIQTIHHFLSDQLSSWMSAVRQYPIRRLVGASGAFDTIEEMTVHERIDALHSNVTVSAFYSLFDFLTHTSHEERRRMEKLPGERVEMIIVAMVLLDFVIRQAGIETITICPYALKEGVLEAMA